MYVVVQAAVTLERCIAVFCSRRYEQMGAHLGCLLVLAVIAISLPISVFALSRWDLSDSTPFCSNVNTDTYQDMYSLICFYNTGVSLFSLLVFVSTRFYNKHQLKRKDLSVSHRYQLQENENVFKILYPEIGFYFIFYVFYGACNVMSYQVHDIVSTRNDFRIFLAAINTIPYYSCLSPAIMWWRLRQSRLERKTAVVEMTTTKQCDVMKAYFETLEAQWGADKGSKSLPPGY